MEKPKKSIEIKEGDIFKLGEHLLLCADARNRGIIQEFLKDIKISLVLTDPPYGVAYVENKDWVGLRGPGGGGHKEHKKIIGDQMQTDESYAEFTRKWIDAIGGNLTAANSFYIFNSDIMICSVREGMKQAGVYYSQMIIWVKNQVVLGRKDYNPQHELIVYGWKGKHKFYRRKYRSVIAHPKPQKSTLHPTMKPVGLLRKLLVNSTKIGDWIYDPFAGSGSTLIAADQTKRKCALVEIDPAYCNTIIQRWQKLNPDKAVDKL